ncbi:LysR substrate-binding domain-containing protein [Bartonella sp. LJL80]
MTNHDALCLMVEAGLGIGILPFSIAQRHSKSINFEIIPLEDEWTKRQLLIGVRSQTSLSEAARLMVSHLQDIDHGQ